jgi:hypothetical protein
VRRRACAAAALLLLFAGCQRKPERPPEPQRLAELQRVYDDLHERLERALDAEPLVGQAYAERGQVVIGARVGLLARLALRVSQGYLQRVEVDLADVDAHAGGELERKTVFGRVTLGEWDVDVNVSRLVGSLAAGTPEVRLRGPDLIEIQVPVHVRKTPGSASVTLTWDSKALANVVCKDFELTREVKGNVRGQEHVLRGAMRLSNAGALVTATPEFPDRTLDLKLDVAGDSWAVVEEALRSQDKLGRCGLLMNPDKGLVKLQALVDRGVKVKLPDSIFRPVSLPARLESTVRVDQRSVDLVVKAESLRVTPEILWSSANIQLKGPAAGPRATDPPRVTGSTPEGRLAQLVMQRAGGGN